LFQSDVWNRCRKIQPPEILEGTPSHRHLAAPDLVTNTLSHRFQEHSTMDAGDLAENGRVTQYMLSLF
jgi:hypothetical protein